MVFKPGESGNLKGRPRGGGWRLDLYKEEVYPRARELMKKGIEVALNGDPIMLKYFLDRVMPTSNYGLPFTVSVNNVNSLLPLINEIFSALENEFINMEQFKILIDSLKNVKDVIVVEEIHQRLEKLENK